MNDARQEALAARTRYKHAEEEYRNRTAHAYDIGLSHPDGKVAARNATTHLIDSLKQYQTAMRRMTRLLSAL
jgi:hypothetical protein